MAENMDCEVTSRFYDEEEKKRFYVEEPWTDSPLILLESEECLSFMIEKESEQLPAADYFARLTNADLDIGARDEILEWIAEVHSYFKFEPVCAYLSVNYLDRFLSIYDLPTGKVWIMQLLGVACLSLAVKIMETDEVYLPLDLQVARDAKFVFEATTIQRMELLVLSTLNWRMNAITPFSFVGYFLKKINGDQIDSIDQSIELILSTLKEIHFLEFKPSEIAAAVAITVIAEQIETVNTEEAISALVQYVQKDKMMKCIELIQELSDDIESSSASSP